MSDNVRFSELVAIEHELRASLFDDGYTAEDRDALIGRFLENEAAIEQKVTAYCAILRRFRNEEQFIKNEEDRLKDRRQRMERARESLEQRFAVNLIAMGRLKIETSLDTIAVTPNSRVEPLFTASKMPDRFVTIRETRDVSKTALKLALEAQDPEALAVAKFAHGVRIS